VPVIAQEFGSGDVLMMAWMSRDALLKTMQIGEAVYWSRSRQKLLEKISTRITNEVADVNRVVLDITSKPPGTIEWD